MATFDIMRRKSALQRPRVREGSQGIDRAFRVCLGRAVRDAFKIQIDVDKLTLDRRSTAELVELVPDFALIAILDGPAQGAGALILSQSLVAGFIEAQTVGRVRAQDLPQRKPTRTDGAMVLALIDPALVMLEKSLSADADVIWAGGFRFSSFLDDPRPLPVVLEDVPLRLLSAEVSLAHGQRKGKILFAVPAEGRFPIPFPQSIVPGDDTGAAFEAAMHGRVSGASVELNAVLMRLSLPMADVLTMAAGGVLPLQDAAIETICLEGLDGRCVAQGKLGQNRGMRAVRLVDTQPASARHAVRAGRILAADTFAVAERRADEIGRRPFHPAQSGAALAQSGARFGDGPSQAQARGFSAAVAGSNVLVPYDLRATGTD